MSSEFADNTYYDRVKKQFVKAQQKKAEMEEKFYPSMTDEYNSLKKDIINLSADLIKFGVSYDEDDEYINILVDDEFYDMYSLLRCSLAPQQRKTEKKQQNKKISKMYHYLSKFQSFRRRFFELVSDLMQHLLL